MIIYESEDYTLYVQKVNFYTENHNTEMDKTFGHTVYINTHVHWDSQNYLHTITCNHDNLGICGGDDEGVEPGEGGHHHEEDNCADDAHETNTGLSYFYLYLFFFCGQFVLGF